MNRLRSGCIGARGALYLDTRPYGSHTLGVDALAAGIPMLSIASREEGRWAERVGGSLLRGVGMENLCVDSLEKYEDEMVALSDTKHNNITETYKNNLQHQVKHGIGIFATELWVRKFEKGVKQAVEGGRNEGQQHDIII